MKNLELAELFSHTADLLAILGANQFRVGALKKVARVLEELTEDVATLAGDDRLDALPGIGDKSAAHIREYLKHGKIGDFMSIAAEVPPGVLHMMSIPTVGPKTAGLLWKEGGILSVPQLKGEIEAGRLRDLPGLGEKKLQKILQNIEHLSGTAGRIRQGPAQAVADALCAHLAKVPGVTAVEYCGSLRRGKETVGDIDIAVQAPVALQAEVAYAVTSHPLCADVIGSGPTKTSIRTTEGIQVDVRVVPEASWGAALQYFTGSKEHNVHLRELAIKQHLKLNEYGVYCGAEFIAGATEASVYAALGLACPPPELREDRGEIEKAADLFTHGTAFPHVLEVLDICGDLHMHTLASDGRNSIADMVAEAKRRGYQYVAITDHSKSQVQAHGLSVARLMEHIAAVRAVAYKVPDMLIWVGAEVDILADGSLDYEDEVLKKLDWVVASPHAALTQDSAAATRRLVRAASHPLVDVVGHPTGRLVPDRKGLEPDMTEVIKAARRSGAALELNANWHRLDLCDRHLQLAATAGVLVCINTDAHSVEDFDMMRFGVRYARRAGLLPAQVLNCKTIEELQQWKKRRLEMHTSW